MEMRETKERGGRREAGMAMLTTTTMKMSMEIVDDRMTRRTVQLLSPLIAIVVFLLWDSFALKTLFTNMTLRRECLSFFPYIAALA